jgi:hypothetical protein
MTRAMLALIVAAFAGAALAAYLIADTGAAAVLGALRSAGWVTLVAVSLAMFGLNADVALAISLPKRGCDLALGNPVILAWQLGEGHGVLKRWAGATLADLDSGRN